MTQENQNHDFVIVRHLSVNVDNGWVVLEWLRDKFGYYKERLLMRTGEILTLKFEQVSAEDQKKLGLVVREFTGCITITGCGDVENNRLFFITGSEIEYKAVIKNLSPKKLI